MNDYNLKTDISKPRSKSSPSGLDELANDAFTDFYSDDFGDAMAEATKRRQSPRHAGYITKVVRSRYDDRYVVCSVPSFLVLGQTAAIFKRFKDNNYD